MAARGIALGGLLAVAVASGCGAAAHAPPPEQAGVSGALDSELAAAAEQVAGGWKTWGAVYSAAHPSALAREDLGAPPKELGERTRLSWEGPIEPLLNGLLARTGWRLVVRGRRPAVPVLVSLSGEFTLFDALKEAGYEAGPRVQVIVREPERVVILAYVPGGGLDTDTGRPAEDGRVE